MIFDPDKFTKIKNITFPAFKVVGTYVKVTESENSELNKQRNEILLYLVNTVNNEVVTPMKQSSKSGIPLINIFIVVLYIVSIELSNIGNHCPCMLR